MLRTSTGVAALVFAVSATAQDASQVIDSVTAAMGAEDLTSIVFSGTAANVNFIQDKSQNGPWPFRNIANYTRALSLGETASRATGETNNQGLFGGPPVAGTYTQNISPDSGAWSQQLDYWVTPWGFLKGAADNNATVHAERVGNRNFMVVSWSPAMRAPSGVPYQVNGYINEDNQVERVETWVEHDMYGDLHVDTSYTDYVEFNGAQVPTRMVQQRGGWPFFQVLVTSATPNPRNIAELLAAPEGAGRGRGRGGPPGGAGRGGAAAPPPATRLAEGVYQINGGYNSFAVEFEDYIVVFEAPQNIARGEELIAQVQQLFPTKPIGYVVNSHPHSDHSSGLAPFVAIGATIVTHENNVAFFEEVFSGPRTLLGDALARSNRKPSIMGIGEKHVFTDGRQRLELYHILDTDLEKVHSNGIVVAVSPSARAMFQADFTLPQPGQTANPFTTSLAEHVDRMQLDFDAYLGVHGSATPQTKADLLAAIGK